MIAFSTIINTTNAIIKSHNRKHYQARFFDETLIPIGNNPTHEDNTNLVAAIRLHSKRNDPDDFSILANFIETNPHSPWIAALQANLGSEYYLNGYYSKALDAWRQAWQLSKEATDLKGKQVADYACGELAYMLARLGRVDELEPLIRSIKERSFSGPSTEKITGAHEGFWNMQNRPEISFRCGPLALYQIKRFLDPKNPGTDLIHASKSSQKGFSLAQLQELSKELGLNYQVAYRESNSAIIFPSVMHLKLEHYAAILRKENDQYLLEDPTFGDDNWVTKEALETESSGYFLIPAGDLPEGWRNVEIPEAENIWGKGKTDDNDKGPTGPCDPQSSEGSNSCPKPKPDCKGMAVPGVHLMPVSLNLTDEPIGYTPPVGPAVKFIVRYNQRDAFPPGLSYPNLGPKWTFDWLSCITDIPNKPAANVTYYIMGGGTRTFTGYNVGLQTFEFQLYDQTKLTRTSPDTYEMLSRDGTKKIFGHPVLPDGSTKRKVFLTQLIDPLGNAVLLKYDSKHRLKSITDAIGQVTLITYDTVDIFKIIKVTDPFGRFASFDYDDSGHLVKITDVIGIISEFTYGSGDFIKSLTTPYGITRFKKNTDGGNTRWLETTYPDGNKDRVEFNQDTNFPAGGKEDLNNVPGGMATRNELLFFRNTFYWDKKAYAEGYPDYSKAKIYHWLHTKDLTITSGVPESVKEPLEGRVWYDYTEQESAYVIGSSNKPSHIGRVLGDGSTQLYTYEYNGFGNVTKMIDPVGRTFSYIYAENGIDLLEIRQTRGGQNQLLSKMTYNNRHQVKTLQDAAGQKGTFTYNTNGQLKTRTNAKDETTTYNYDGDGYLIFIEGPLAGDTDVNSFTYDSFGRVKSRTDESGYTLTFNYDKLDRLRKIIFPDSTFNLYIYPDPLTSNTPLDLKTVQDRAGRQTSFEYNEVRQMTKRTDPLNRSIMFEWCKCGDLKSLTDPTGRTTKWKHDIQGRLIGKEYVDGSKIAYLYENNISRLRQRIDEKLQVTQYNYYRDNNLSIVNYTNAEIDTPSVSYTYDENYNRLRSMTDGIGTTQYRYVPINPEHLLGAGQLASVEGPLPDSAITFGYDKLGRRISTAINGVSSSLTYDAAGRVLTTTTALGVFENSYYGNSFRKKLETYPNGQTVGYEYGTNMEDHSLKRITNKSGNALVSEFLYGYDIPTGQITSWSQQADTDIPSIYSLEYDDTDQLITASVSSNGDIIKNFTYKYDAAGNRLTEKIATTTRKLFYNALNELTSVEGGINVPASYQWDAEHRLISVTQGDKKTEFTYDGFGRRVRIRYLVNDIEESNCYFVWCDEKICEERTSTGVVLKRFFDQGVKVETGTMAGKFYYAKDHLGSIRELTNKNGSVEGRYSYDPFGTKTAQAGSINADFGFAGMFWSPEAGLNLTWFRAYFPALGRWLSRDIFEDSELEEGGNLYMYVRNNPVNLIDPLGLCCEMEVYYVVVVSEALAYCLTQYSDLLADDPNTCEAYELRLEEALSDLRDCYKKPCKSGCKPKPVPPPPPEPWPYPPLPPPPLPKPKPKPTPKPKPK